MNLDDSVAFTILIFTACRTRLNFILGMERIGQIRIEVPQGADKTIVLVMNYSGPTIKVKGHPKGNPNAAAHVEIRLQAPPT